MFYKKINYCAEKKFNQQFDTCCKVFQIRQSKNPEMFKVAVKKCLIMIVFITFYGCFLLQNGFN